MIMSQNPAVLEGLVKALLAYAINKKRKKKKDIGGAALVSGPWEYIRAIKLS